MIHHTDAQGAGKDRAVPFDVLHIAVEFGGGLQQQCTGIIKLMPGLGEPETGAAAAAQRHAQAFFQMRQMGADGRLRHIQARLRRTHALAFHNRHKSL